ncbi:MAG: class flavin-dependent oxidoreductase [Solirubrobacterales bacterium]|nr:class flavin-dependent oxidoreductase [Solirubrobacterales bacterium]
MRICLMIEGQEDVTWEDWRRLAVAAETGGFDALFRSDHYVSVMEREQRGSLDAWATLCALAPLTERIRLGTLVSPATFRHPSVLAKMAVTADHASGGRIEVGLGAGWHDREHAAYGFPFPPMRERMEVLAEQLEIVHGQWTQSPFAFSGRHYEVAEADHLPKPVQRPHPPLIMGGLAKARSVELAARWADEYNTIFAPPDTCAERRAAVRAACEAAGRDPDTVTFSLMTGMVIGAERADVERRAHEVAEFRGDPPDDAAASLRAEHWIVGTVPEALEQLRTLEAAGVERIMLQHVLHRDLEVLDLIGREIIPALA